MMSKTYGREKEVMEREVREGEAKRRQCGGQFVLRK